MPPPADRPLPAARLARAACAGAVLAVGLIVLVGLLGPSAAQPPLGPREPWPPYAAAADPSPWLVTGALLVALLLGAGAVGAGLAALRRGWAPDPKRLLAASALAVAALVAVPPMGSADHLVYAAYGSMAVHGADPYATSPAAFAARTGDPVAAAVEAPWQDTPSVYGPLATAEQAVAAWLGKGSLRGTVALLALANGLAFLGAALLLQRIAGDPAARRRAAWLFACNPLLLWAVVAGAHLDGLACVAAVGALAALRRSPLLAGALAGAAGVVKLSFGLYGLALLLAVRHAPRSLAQVTAGGAVVALGAYAVTGPHALAETRHASRMISRATPWNLVRGWLDGALGSGTSRPLVGALAAAAAVALAVLLGRAGRVLWPRPGDDVRAGATRWAAVVVGGWLLTAPYALPWYDVALWAPLAALPASALDGPLLVRLAAMACAYVPGRVEEAAPLPAPLATAIRALRAAVTPAVALATVLAVVAVAALAARAARDPSRGRIDTVS